jgi:AraC family transcriptional regulator
VGNPIIAEAGSHADRRPPSAHTGFERIERRGRLLAVRARYSSFDFGSSGAYVAETFGRTPSFLCVVQLHDFPPTDGWRDGRHFRMPLLATGSCQIYDLRHEWRTDVPHPFDNVHLNITQTALDQLAEVTGIRRIEIAPPPIGSDADQTLRHLALSLIPAFRRPTELSALFADHIFSAATLHIAEAYGSAVLAATRTRGGLAPWQERRAMDMLMAQLDGDVGLASLADACGLSPGHFAKAFKRTTGVPPHRWLLKQRLSRARDMLLHSNEPLGAIALSSGFADQSHLTRVFSKAEGVGPAAWRRMRRS